MNYFAASGYWYSGRMARKNAAAVALGRRGGKKKVPKGLATMSAEDRKKIQSAGGKARWAKKAEGKNEK
jgi:hypothetical protein